MDNRGRGVLLDRLRKHHRVECSCGAAYHMHVLAKKRCVICGCDLRSLPFVVEDTDKVLRFMMQKPEPTDYM